MIQIFDKINAGLEKFVSLCAANAKIVVGLFISLLLVGSAIAGMGYKKKSAETAAFSELSVLEREFNNWKLSLSPNPESKEKPAAVDTAKLQTQLTDFIKNKPELKASHLASLMLVELGTSLGQEAEILKVLETLPLKSNGQLLEGLATLKKGDLFANQNQCDQALKAWSQIVGQKKLPFLKDMAHLKSGLCEEKLAQKDKALMHYESVISAKDLKTDRWAYKEAQKYKRALTWTQN